MDHKTDTDRGREALDRYLKDCDTHAIVPDVGGAFHAAFMAGRASLPLPGAQEAVAWRYRMAGDLQWQYTERKEQFAHADEVQPLAAPQPALSAGWVSVDERLPEVVPGMSGCIEAIAHWDDGAIETSWFWRGGRWQHADGEMNYHRESKVTHWQPLPAPPIPASEAGEA